jgi:hypothetical protein
MGWAWAGEIYILKRPRPEPEWLFGWPRKCIEYVPRIPKCMTMGIPWN